jgi:hypothetical protein
MQAQTPLANQRVLIGFRYSRMRNGHHGGWFAGLRLSGGAWRAFGACLETLNARERTHTENRALPASIRHAVHPSPIRYAWNSGELLQGCLAA